MQPSLRRQSPVQAVDVSLGCAEPVPITTPRPQGTLPAGPVESQSCLLGGAVMPFSMSGQAGTQGAGSFTAGLPRT